jgi:hypothetical protein
MSGIDNLIKMLQENKEEEVNIVNLTPHEIMIGAVKIPSTGVVRCQETSTKKGTIKFNGSEIEIVSKSFGAISGLPEQKEGTVYVLSGLAATAAWEQGRDDVYCPGTAVRDDKGAIVGVSNLAGKP